MQLLDRKLLKQFDWVLFGLTLLIPCVGLVVLYSAGYAPERAYSLPVLPITIESPAFLRQIMYLLVGILAIGFALMIPAHVLEKYSYFLYGLCLVALSAVFVVGLTSHGATRWFSLGGVNVQPSEIVKLGVIIALARYLSRHTPSQKLYRLRELIIPMMLIGLPMVLIMKQPDLGTALSVGFIGAAMLLFVGVSPKSLMILGGAVIAAVLPAWHFVLKPYQKRRVLALLNPDADPLGSGYHIIQSKIAVGSGAFSGKGFLQGTQTQLEFLPEHTTDFIFSVLAEEWGFVGSIFVLALFALLLYRMLNIVSRSRDAFPALVVFGVVALIFFHVLVNIGMVLGLMPVVGLPLALFSYGGSSLLTSMLAIGLVLGLGMRRLAFL